MPCDAPDASGTLGIMHACSRQLAQPATSVDSTHQQQQHKQPAKGKASAGKPKPAKVPAAGSKAKSPRSSSGASATKKQCVAVRHAPTAKHEPACEDDEGDDCELSDWAAAAAGTDRKGPISHSTVEKQRRDRINALIDLLAEQVPPVSSKYSGSQAAGEARHVVYDVTFAIADCPTADHLCQQCCCRWTGSAASNLHLLRRICTCCTNHETSCANPGTCLARRRIGHRYHKRSLACQILGLLCHLH